MESTSTLTNRLLAVIAGVVVFWALGWSSTISMPFAAAIFLIAVLWPIKRWTNRVFPATISYAVAVLAMLVILGLFIWAVWMSVQNIAGNFADYRDQFDRLYQSARTVLQDYGLSVPDFGSQRAMDMLQSMATQVYSGLATAGLIVALVIMGFPAVAQISNQMRSHMPRRAERFGGTTEQIAKKFQVYVTTTTLNCLITGVLTYVFALAVGLDFALTWAVLTFLLNYVPTIGSIISVFPPALFALVQYEGWLMPAAVFAGFSAIQLSMGAFVFPKLSGERQAILPVFVLAAMIVWGWLWGIPGALLGVPITAGILIACAQFEPTRWITAMTTQPGSRLAEGRARQDEGQKAAAD